VHAYQHAIVRDDLPIDFFALEDIR